MWICRPRLWGLFRRFRHVVTCVDKDEAKVAALKRGEIPIFEPGLDDLVAANARKRRLFFSQDIGEAVRGAEAVFIAVGRRGPAR